MASEKPDELLTHPVCSSPLPDHIKNARGNSDETSTGFVKPSAM
jgi:hypothetical protein